MAQDDERLGSAPATQLPDFDRPPVAEVVMAAAFKSLEALNTAQVGLMWRDLFADDFPLIEEKSPIAVQFERFGPPALAEPTFSFQAIDTPPWPRLWFLSDDGSQLVQFQRDWMARNWRRTPGLGGAEYPRYPSLRERFEIDARRFVNYVADRRWGEVAFTQCELTYINHIDLDALELGPGDLAEVLGLVDVPANDPFLPTPESIQLSTQYLIRERDEAVARLYVTVSPAFRREDRSPILVLTLTAKGPPPGPGLDGVLHFLDTARIWVVNGFTNLIRPKMQVAWGRRRHGER